MAWPRQPYGFRGVAPCSTFNDLGKTILFTNKSLVLGTRILAGFLFLATLAFAFGRSWFISRYFNGYPINGPFQTYEPLSKLLMGQIPGRDFFVFHGIGVPYVLFAPFYLFGGNLAASELASNLVNSLLYIILNALILGALGLRRAVAIALSCVLFAFAIGTTLYPIDGHSLILGGTNLGIRSGMTLLLGFVFFKQFERLQEAGSRVKAIALLSCLAGFGIIFSVENALPNILAVAISIFLLSLGQRLPLWRGITNSALALGVSLVGLILTVTVLTAGHPLQWLEFTLGDVPKDQYWYFGGPPNPFVNELTFYLNMPISLVIGVVMMLVAAIEVVRAKSRVALVCFYMLFATFTSGMIATLGIGSFRYFLPFERVVILSAIPSLVYGYRLIKAWRPQFSLPEGVSKAAPALSLAFVLTATVVAVKQYATFAQANVTPKNFANTDTLGGNLDFTYPTTDAYQYHESLGTAFGSNYLKTLEMAEYIQANTPADFDRSKETLLFSTYAAALELFLGEQHPTRFNYIIHALGPKKRQEYVQTLIDSKPLFVTTLRRDFTVYEIWLQRSHWDFYRHLLLNYEPVFESRFALLWKRRSAETVTYNAPYEIPGIYIDRPDFGGFTYSFEMKDVANVPDNAIIDVTFEYEVEPWPMKLPILSNIPRCIVQPRNTWLDYGFAVPSYAKTFSFPLNYKKGSIPSIDVYLTPELRAKVRPINCKARVLPLSDPKLLDTVSNKFPRVP